MAKKLMRVERRRGYRKLGGQGNRRKEEVGALGTKAEGARRVESRGETQRLLEKEQKLLWVNVSYWLSHRKRNNELQNREYFTLAENKTVNSIHQRKQPNPAKGYRPSQFFTLRCHWAHFFLTTQGYCNRLRRL